VLVVGALGILAWATARAIDLETPRAVASSPYEAPDSLPRDRRNLFPPRRILAAVESDPFHPLRVRSATRFQIVGAAPVANRNVEPAVRLVGTTVSPDGGFAICSWAGRTPRIVRIGERLEDWTLSKVTPGAAEFTGASGSIVVVRIAKAGS
jgi:hypothetical protein